MYLSASTRRSHAEMSRGRSAGTQRNPPATTPHPPPGEHTRLVNPLRGIVAMDETGSKGGHVVRKRRGRSMSDTASSQKQHLTPRKKKNSPGDAARGLGLAALSIIKGAARPIWVETGAPRRFATSLATTNRERWEN